MFVGTTHGEEVEKQKKGYGLTPYSQVVTFPTHTERALYFLGAHIASDLVLGPVPTNNYHQWECLDASG